MFYHDGRHPLIYMYEPPMQKEEYEAAVDELVGTPIEAIMFCLGDGRTVLHDTKVGELWGTPNEKWPHLGFRRAHQNARHLIEEGNDPLRVICDRAHAKGLLLYATLLVQQGSGDPEVDPGNFARTSNFRLENKHLEIGARGDLDTDAPWTQFLDFKHEEVREERFALIQETLDQYPVDGFELQLNYGLAYFHPKEVLEGRAIMTQWVRRVYDAVKSSGQDRELVLRVPTSVERAMAIGLDLKEWVDQGIVDVLVGEEIYKGSELDPSANFRELVAAAKGSQCRVHAAVYSHLDSDRLNEATIETIRAAACNYWEQGIDGLYLSQWFSQWPYEAPFYEKLRELPHPDVMAPKDKTYHVSTETGGSSQTREGPGAYVAAQRARIRNPLMSAGPEAIQRLPVGLEVGRPARVQFAVSDDLPRWDRVGRVHEVLLRVRVTESTELDRLSFKLNGRELPNRLLRKINRMYLMRSPRYRVFGYWYVFRLDREYWPVKGANSLEATLLERDPDVTPQIGLRDVELDIRYLMGKNYHRGFVDPDLGPYESAAE
jgi:hypothetical protein